MPLFAISSPRFIIGTPSIYSMTRTLLYYPKSSSLHKKLITTNMHMNPYVLKSLTKQIYMCVCVVSYCCWLFDQDRMCNIGKIFFFIVFSSTLLLTIKGLFITYRGWYTKLKSN
ncbi:hypothetical protein V8G54_013872 [Vigna mungo]|uniref:Uncharacterized protein n=1 Tax=Vigna mungo TaxID=3915 RepID=A0AAQ3NGN1_VIGMU